MRLMQLVEGFSWQAAIQDANRRGLQLHQNETKRWILSLIEKDQRAFIEKAKSAGMYPTPVDQYGHRYTWSFVTPKDYKQWADQLEIARDNPDQIFKASRDKLITFAWDELQKLKNDVSTWARPGEYQLFVPRPQIFREYYPDAPVLRKVPSGTGSTKPINAFWTSTLEFSHEHDGKKYYSSDWVDWIENAGMTKWWNPTGFVYRYQPSADIYPMHGVYDAKKIYRIISNLRGESTGSIDADGLDTVKELYEKMPWSDIAKHFDGVYHFGRSGSDDYFMSGWDAESTAWLNTDVLKLVGKVRIRSISSYEDDD